MAADSFQQGLHAPGPLSHVSDKAVEIPAPLGASKTPGDRQQVRWA